MNRRDLDLGVLTGLRVTMLPGGRVRVEPTGVLAYPDESPPVVEYASLSDLIRDRLKGGAR